LQACYDGTMKDVMGSLIKFSNFLYDCVHSAVKCYTVDQIFSHGTNIDWDTTGITASQNIEKTDWHKCISTSKTYP